MTQKPLYDYHIGQFSVERNGLFDWTAHWYESLDAIGGQTIAIKLSINGFLLKRTAFKLAKRRASEAVECYQARVIERIDTVNKQAETELASDD